MMVSCAWVVSQAQRRVDRLKLRHQGCGVQHSCVVWCEGEGGVKGDTQVSGLKTVGGGHVPIAALY